MSQSSDSDLNRNRQGKGKRLVGLLVGLLLLMGAVVVVWGRRDLLSEGISRMAHPAPGMIGLLALVLVGQLVLGGFLFSILMKRFGRVGILEMQALIASSALLNYLPLRAGMFGRLAYHRAVNGIALRHSTRTVIEALGISVGGAVLVAGILVLAIQGNVNPWLSASGVGVGLLAGCTGAGLRRWCGAGMLRWVEFLLWAVRYHLVFGFLGVQLDWTGAFALAGLSAMVNMIPFLSNGLGAREWGVGLVTPLLTPHTMELAIVAELVNRAAEIAVFLVTGTVGMAYLSGRRKLGES